MAYQALYRRWRPLTFDDVRGQDAIVTTLKNQIRTGRIGHAYLFCGTRGTGKTSVAKIFARAVNCAHTAERDGNPCNECGACRSILNGSSMNVFEIDAASNNGVDNIRDIREQVEYPPTEGRFKVYIIDEVHMLSAGAFNALLKTLEEPPAYVIFILATTDPQKIPQTILSRCQRYDFRRIGADTIAARIRELEEAEGLDIEERAVRYVARAADGSMRDALSLLDQCLAFHYGQRLTYENVLDVLGAVDTSVFSDLYRALCRQDVEAALKIINDLVNAGREIGQLVNDFIWYMRNILLAGSTAGQELLDISAENEERLREDAASADKGRLLQLMSAMSELSNRMRFAAQKRILLEVELIRFCTAGSYGKAQTRPAASAGAAASAPRGSALSGAAPLPPSGSGGALAGAAFTTQAATVNGQGPAGSGGLPQTAPQPIHMDASLGVIEEVSGEPEALGVSEDAKASEAIKASEDAKALEAAETRKTETEASPGEQPALRAEERTAASAEGPASGALLEAVRENWDMLLKELSPANRAVFSGTLLREEQAGSLMVIFKNAINYRIAAMNRDENGLRRLSELCRERMGLSLNFLARQAKAGEFTEPDNRITEDDLLKIHFPIDRE